MVVEVRVVPRSQGIVPVSIRELSDILKDLVAEDVDVELCADVQDQFQKTVMSGTNRDYFISMIFSFLFNLSFHFFLFWDFLERSKIYYNTNNDTKKQRR